MLLVSGGASWSDRTGITHPLLGELVTPDSLNQAPETMPWAIDNAAFSGFHADRYQYLLDRDAGRPGCLFATAPDVVADAEKTEALFWEWLPRMRAAGHPVALVLQDGIESVPWDEIGAVFVGGTTEFKLGERAAGIVREARRRGLWSHMGRVNSFRRFRRAAWIGCNSVDGSSYSKWKDTRIPTALSVLDAIERQGRIW